MRDMYANAFSEVDVIFNIMPENLLNKIPTGFKQMIKENKNKNYMPEISEPLEDYTLMEETLIILSLIYRDFLCSKEEKEKLQLRDTQQIKEIEEKLKEKLKEKYNPDNLFKNKNNQNNQEITNTVAMVEYKESIFKKIINKIKRLFRK